MFLPGLFCFLVGICTLYFYKIAQKAESNPDEVMLFHIPKNAIKATVIGLEEEVGHNKYTREPEYHYWTTVQYEKNGVSETKTIVTHMIYEVGELVYFIDKGDPHENIILNAPKKMMFNSMDPTLPVKPSIALLGAGIVFCCAGLFLLFPTVMSKGNLLLLMSAFSAFAGFNFMKQEKKFKDDMKNGKYVEHEAEIIDIGYMLRGKHHHKVYYPIVKMQIEGVNTTLDIKTQRANHSDIGERITLLVHKDTKEVRGRYQKSRNMMYAIILFSAALFFIIGAFAG